MLETHFLDECGCWL